MTDPIARNPIFTSPFNIFLLGVSVVAGAAYLLIGFFTQDFLWFWPVFNQQPSEIVIHCHGEQISLEKSSPNFLPLTYLIEQQISGEKQVDDVNFSGEVYNQLTQSHTILSLEIHFPQPIRIHSHHSYFSDVDTLLYIVGGEADRWVDIYGIKDGQPTMGRLRVAGNPKIVEYLSQEILCTGPCEGK